MRKLACFMTPGLSLLLVFGLAACSGSSKSKGAVTANPATAGGTAAPAGGGTASGTSAPAGSGSGTKSLPANACGLLTTADVTPLVAKVDTPKPLGGTANEVGCNWSAQFTPGGPMDLSEVVVKVTALPVSADEIKLSLAAEAKDSGREVSGVGDYAIVTSVIPANAEVKAIVGSLFVTVEYSGTNGKDKQDQVVALAKLVAAKI